MSATDIGNAYTPNITMRTGRRANKQNYAYHLRRNLCTTNILQTTRNRRATTSRLGLAHPRRTPTRLQTATTKNVQLSVFAPNPSGVFCKGKPSRSDVRQHLQFYTHTKFYTTFRTIPLNTDDSPKIDIQANNHKFRPTRSMFGYIRRCDKHRPDFKPEYCHALN